MNTFPLSIVMPIYNEESSLKNFLPEVISFCKQHSFQLIMVNDGSKDGSGKIIAAADDGTQIVAIHNKLNKGYGGAIKEGVKRAEAPYVITIDADGQHLLSDVLRLYSVAKENDADMVLGQRKSNSSGLYRQAGKGLIKSFAKMLMHVPINDLNSGMKLYNTGLGKQYIYLCPDSMAFSDTITLIFINKRHLVLETPISIKDRENGKSTINTYTAIETLKQILNIIILFNPMKIFFPLALTSIIAGLAWGIPIILKGNGVSVGAMLGIVTGIIFFLLGLLAEQLSMIRKNNL